MSTIQAWIYIFSTCVLLVYAQQSPSWPSCQIITTTQNIFNVQDGNRHIFDFPVCTTTPFNEVCQRSCCYDILEGANFPALMGGMYETLRYYVNKFPEPTGTHPMPFFYYDIATDIFQLTSWEPANIKKFQFTVAYFYGFAFLRYSGTEVAPGANDLYFAPYLRPLWQPEYFVNSKMSLDHFMSTVPTAWYGEVNFAENIQCACGYYQAIDIHVGAPCASDYEKSCFRSYRSSYKCVDIDECQGGYKTCELIPNSYCVNTEGSFRCDCYPGYIQSSDSKCLDVGTEIATQVTPTSTTARFVITSADLPKPQWSYVFNITDISNPSYPIPVYKATQVKVSQEMAKTGVLVSNLNPGTNYSISWDILDANNSVITELYHYTSEETRFTTLCTCGIKSDAPVLLGSETITQNNGYVFFKFMGNSMCGNAVTFARQAYEVDGTLSKSTVFTPNYFFTGGECSPVPYEPGKSAADNLVNSKLIVGTRYRYTFRAVGNKYIGDPSFMDFVIRWESSIIGFVGLKPTLGSLPAEGVVVQWLLKNDDGVSVVNGTTITSKSGRFTIHPIALIPFLNDRDYPMHISFSKITRIDESHEIQHEFLCNNGRVNCTSTDIVIHLKHLDFNVPVNVIDATSVPVSGKVYVADTSVNPDGTRWGGDGCPVEKAKVCLVDRSPTGFHNELACTETSFDGTYTLAGVIGSRVSIAVTYNNHSFEYKHSVGFPDFSTDIEIQPHQVYEHNDFIDTTTVPMQLTVAGGICDMFLGVAQVSYRITGCLWGGVILNHQSMRVTYNTIPAHNMMFSVDAVEQRPDIDLLPKQIDLSLLPSRAEMSKPAIPNQLQAEETITDLRFQYDGIAKIQVSFQGDMNNDCNAMTPDISDYGADSLHVLLFQRRTVAMILIERDLGAGLICDAVDPSTQLVIQNNLGLIADDPSDTDYAVAVAASRPPEVLALLYHCNQGCAANVTHDYDEISNRNKRARIEFEFMTGRPNVAAPFVKQFIVRTTEANSVTYKAAVVIIGQYNKGDLFSVGLPTYKPVLIIRDPPGGSSYAFYENVQSTIRIESFIHKEYTGLDANFKTLVGVKGDIDMCSGIGVEVCKDVAKIKDLVGNRITFSDMSLSDLNYTTNSGGLKTTWSYRTSSSSPLFAGNLTDTYVVPNLSMKFSVIDVVNWNQSICTASVAEETAYNLESPENVPALSFLTGLEIITTEIPSLELNIASTKQKLAETTFEAERKELQQELNALNDALQGWHAALELNAQTKQEVVEGKNQVKPHEWFDKIVSNNMGALNTTGMSHNSALLSKELMSHAELRSLYKNAAKSTTDLESTNTIKFAGGGGEFTYRLSASKLKQHVSNLGGSKIQTNKGELLLETDNAIAMFDMVADLSVGLVSDSAYENLRTDETSESTDIGFVLADPDGGDQFDVDIFIDPVFGTFIFHTRSGKSHCKHEEGTVNRQLVQMELVSIPPRIVLEDDPMVFHLRIVKLGTGSIGYMLSQEYREDVDALFHYPFLPREYPILEYGQSFITSMTLRRGPEKYVYPAFTLLLQPSCEFLALPLLGDKATVAKVELYNYIDPIDQSKKIVFARPCSPIILQGDIAKDQSFSITSKDPYSSVKVVVQNPTAAVMKWTDAIQDPNTRLQRVQLYYRPAGSAEWMVGQYLKGDTMVDIDFALDGMEDAYGYATVGWEVSHLMDGNYEMQVRTVCDDVADAPAIFNGQETEVIRGVLDRKPPKLYGEPQPQSQLPIGQPIMMTFDKTLDCSLPLKFVVELQVFGIDRIFDNDNLQMICEGRRISIQFDSANTNVDELIGKRVSMKVTYVVDSNLNLMTSAIAYSADIVPAVDPLSCQRQLDELEVLRNELRKDVDAAQLLIHAEIERMRQEAQAHTNEIIDSVRSMLSPKP